MPNDFIISLRSFQGGFELNTIEGIVSPAYTVLRGEEELAQPKFFKQNSKKDNLMFNQRLILKVNK